jgi:hypothetical protein
LGRISVTARGSEDVVEQLEAPTTSRTLKNVWKKRMLIRLTVLLGQTSCTATCTVDFCKVFCFSWIMKADLRISIKDYHRNKNLKILLFRPPFQCRGFLVRMNPDASGQADGLGGTGLSRLLAAVRKSLVKGLASGPS